jgi:hypothetical protein
MQTDSALQKKPAKDDYLGTAQPLQLMQNASEDRDSDESVNHGLGGGAIKGFL